MCQAVKTGFMYELAKCLLGFVPGRVGELFPLSADGAVFMPHRLEKPGALQIELALRTTISAISLRYKLADPAYDYLDEIFEVGMSLDVVMEIREELGDLNGYFDDMEVFLPVASDKIAELPGEIASFLVDIAKEIIYDEGLAPSLEAVDLRKGSHFMMLQAIVVLFRACLADNPRASYDFLGSVFYALDQEVGAAVTAAVNEAVEGGLGRIKAYVGEAEFKKIVEAETRSALARFPRIGRIIFLNAVGRAVEAAIKRADELALAKIPPLPPLRH